MDDLQETFRQVDLSEDKVSETTNQTKVIVEQSQSRAQRIAELIRRVVEDFKLTLDANERFQLLSKTLDKGRNGLTRLLKHSARGCNPVMPTDALNR